jgi:hypothetical protein
VLLSEATNQPQLSCLNHGMLLALHLLSEDTLQRSVQLVAVPVVGLLEAGSAARVKVTCIACTLDLSEHTYIAGREGWRGRV